MALTGCCDVSSLFWLRRSKVKQVHLDERDMDEDNAADILAHRGKVKRFQIESSWFNYVYAKYIPFMVRERFALDNAICTAPELDRFQVRVTWLFDP